MCPILEETKMQDNFDLYNIHEEVKSDPKNHSFLIQ